MAAFSELSREQLEDLLLAQNARVAELERALANLAFFAEGACSEEKAPMQRELTRMSIARAEALIRDYLDGPYLTKARATPHPETAVSP